MMLKIKILTVIFMFFLGQCHKEKRMSLADCGTGNYTSSEMHFSDSDTLIFKTRVVVFSDTVTPLNSLHIQRGIETINSFWMLGLIGAELQLVENIADPEAYNNFQDHAFYGRKYYKEGYLNIFLYNDVQINMPPDFEGITGSAPGIPAPFFSVRYSYFPTNTSAHEFGHAAAALWHIDSYDSSPSKYSSYSGDLVCATPKDVELHKKVDVYCHYKGDNPELNNYDKDVLSCNLMSWVYQHCRNCLIDEQFKRARFKIDQSDRLLSLLKKKER